MTNEQEIECGDLRVVIRWRGDRYGHTVERRIGGQWMPLLESVEGIAEIRDDWPPSPVLQSLHFEQRPNGPVALLVGHAGSSHWSVSTETDTNNAALIVDAACRITQRPGYMGSSYRLLQADANYWISLEAVSSDASASTQVPPHWTICPPEPGQWPATIRWRYSICSIV